MIDPTKPASFNASTNFDIRDMAHLLLLNAKRQYELGNNRKGLESIIASLRLAKRVHEGSTGLIHHVIGMAVSALTIESVSAQLASETDRELIQETLDALVANEPLNEEFAESWRWEYQLIKKFVIAIADGKVSIGAFGGTRPPKGGYERLLGTFFKKNMTLEKMVEMFDRRIEDAETSLAQRPNRGKESELDTWTRYVSINFAGIMLADGSGAILSGVDSENLRVFANYRLQQLLAAVRLYEIDQGSVPNSLDQLVPVYVRKIPIDSHRSL